MFLEKLKKIFLLIILISIFFLIMSWYKNYQFSNNDLDQKTLNKISQKEKELKYLAFANLKLKVQFPIIISDKLSSNLYGLTSYSKTQEIKIYLNKKRFKESMDYMINDVLPHEYAHAIIFHLKKYTKDGAGHSVLWQKVCKKLDGLKCQRFVNRNDIVFGKTNF